MDHNRGSYNPTTCYVASELWAAGVNLSGSLGQNDVASKSSPVQIAGYQWVDLVAGSCFAIATKREGTMWAWGLNSQGRLGQNDRVHRSSPVQVPGTDWIKVSAGLQHAHAIKSDGTLWAWGSNSAGQLGNSAITDRSSPVQIPGTNWIDIASASCSTFALKSDGTLWAWGANNVGRLGDNAITSKSSPVQIPGTTWCQMASGVSTAAIKTDNTLWIWGNNNTGVLGQNDRVHRSSPVQIPGTNWICVKTSSCHSLALRNDNTLWVWGLNTDGQLGLNDRVHRSSPVQIPGTDWIDICTAGIADFSLARRSDGTLWAWGENTNGQLADNTTVHRSSPVQIAGTDWTEMSVGSQNAYFFKTNIINNGTWTAMGTDIADILDNDSSYVMATPSSYFESNDKIYARDFKFCMGPKSKIIEANVITRMQSISSGGLLYGGTSNGWYEIQFIDNQTLIDSDLGDKSSSGTEYAWQNRFAKITNPSITPSQAMSNTFGVRLGALATASPVPILWVDSVIISLTTENSANAVTQGNQILQWQNAMDIL